MLSILFFAHQGQVNRLAFSPDGRTLASGSQEDLAIIVWDVSNLRAPVKLIPPISTAPWAVPGVAFSADGDRLLAGIVDGTITTWQMTVETWQTATCQRVGRNFSQTEWRLYSPDLPYQATCAQWPANCASTAPKSHAAPDLTLIYSDASHSRQTVDDAIGVVLITRIAQTFLKELLRVAMIVVT